MSDVFTIRSSALPDGARVVSFRGTEGISRPYVFEIYVQISGAEAHSFDLGEAVGAKGTLVISREDQREPFVFAGIFNQVTLLHETEERALFRVVLVPEVWRLSQTLHSRIYTQQSIPEIIEAVLQDGGLTSQQYALRLSGQYKPEEHVCQYGESHLDFLSRWMEREGLYYFFEHAEGGETLVITDDKSFHKPLNGAAIRYFPQGGADVTAGEHLDTFMCRHNQLPASVRYKDYDYNKPTLDVSGSAAVSSSGLGEINLHGARLFTPDAAKRLAKVRAEELKSRERVFTASGTALYLRSGNTFSLTDHPRAAFDAEYLAVEVEHTGNQLGGGKDVRRLTGIDTDEVYRVAVTAIPADVQHRAEQRAAWPRIYGTEHGVVDGEADSEYAQIDDHGRYLVRFAFDESSLKDGKASTWVRMMQPHGGGVEGWHFPLRKATEVLFTFLGGDPDRPVIAGVVPNALTPSPVTRANHTRNVIQTGGRNRVEMEDKAGYERITISTPHEDSYIRFGARNDHNMIIHTNGTTLLDAGDNLDVTVGGKKTETVAKATTEWYMSTKDETVTGKSTVTVHGGQEELFSTQDTTVKGHQHETVGGNKHESVGGASFTKVGSEMVTEMGGDWVQNIGGHVKQRTNGSGSWFTGGLSYKVHVGAVIDVALANRNNIVVGAGVGIILGMRTQVIGGLRFDLTAGVRVDANLGTYIQANSSPQVRIGPAAIDLSSAKLGRFSTKIASAATWLTRNSVTVQTSGTAVHN